MDVAGRTRSSAQVLKRIVPADSAVADRNKWIYMGMLLVATGADPFTSPRPRLEVVWPRTIADDESRRSRLRAGDRGVAAAS